MAKKNSSILTHINYYEAIILMFASLLLISSFYYKADSQALPSILSVLPFLISSTVLLVLDIKRYDTKLMAFFSVLSIGGFIGLINFSLLVSLVMLASIAIRVAKSPDTEYATMIILAIAGMGAGFFVNYAFNFIDIGIFEPSILGASSAILLGLCSVLFVFIEYTRLFELIHANEVEAERNNKRIQSLAFVNNNLARFVPDQIWQPIIGNNTHANLFNKRAKLTVFFSDIVGFTELSDNLNADVLAEILSTYMDRMTMVAKRHDAVLDKFIGDGMMCFFGAHGHKSIQANAVACVEMALDMRREMRDLRRKWQSEGFDGLYVRMGINTGFCHVGNFGTDLRMSYTVIGKEVNLASRLESIANPDEIIISQSTYDYVGYEYTCEMAGRHVLKGFDDPVSCWRVRDRVNSELKVAQWVDYDLPGFNLHLNFKDIKNYDYEKIRNHLAKAIERVDSAEVKSNLTINGK